MMGTVMPLICCRLLIMLSAKQRFEGGISEWGISSMSSQSLPPVKDQQVIFVAVKDTEHRKTHKISFVQDFVPTFDRR